MKKLHKLSSIILIPIVLGVILNVVGSTSGNLQLSRVGIKILSIGVPITVFALVVVGIILVITGKAGNTPNSEDMAVSEKEREFDEIEDINTSYGRESQIKQGEYTMRQSAKIYKNSSPKEKILGWVFVGFLVLDLALAFVFIQKRLIIGFIICICIFAVTILLCLIITKTREWRSINAKVDINNSKLLCGKVKACLVSSTTSVGGGGDYSTTRITGVTYRVVVESEGNTYTGYSRRFFETGEPVVFAIVGKNRISILDNDKFIKEVDEVLNKEDSDDSF